MPTTFEAALEQACARKDIAALRALAQQEREALLYTTKLLAAVLDKTGPLTIAEASIARAIPAYSVSSQGNNCMLVSTSTAPGRVIGR